MTDARPDDARPGEVPTTANPLVDAVLDEVSRVHEQPLDEHPAIFERAHDQLRAALDSTRS